MNITELNFIDNIISKKILKELSNITLKYYGFNNCIECHNSLLINIDDIERLDYMNYWWERCNDKNEMHYIDDPFDEDKTNDILGMLSQIGDNSIITRYFCEKCNNFYIKCKTCKEFCIFVASSGIYSENKIKIQKLSDINETYGYDKNVIKEIQLAFCYNFSMDVKKGKILFKNSYYLESKKQTFIKIIDGDKILGIYNDEIDDKDEIHFWKCSCKLHKIID